VQERQLQTFSAIERRLGTVCLSTHEFYAEFITEQLLDIQYGTVADKDFPQSENLGFLYCTLQKTMLTVVNSA
jgi:hypothetical protein